MQNGAIWRKNNMTNNQSLAHILKFTKFYINLIYSLYCEMFPLNDMPNRNLLHKLVFLALPLVLYFFLNETKLSMQGPYSLIWYVVLVKHLN